MTEEAKKAKREYYKKYRAKNAERIKEREKAWRKANPEKVREHQNRYWLNKYLKENGEYLAVDEKK